MNKILGIFLIVFGIAIIISIFSLNSEVVVGEQLCVDGSRNINLEGMMCEKTEYKIDGLSKNESILINLIIFAIGLFLYVCGLRLLITEIYSEDSL